MFLYYISSIPFHPLVYDTEYVKDCKTVYDTVNEQVRSPSIVAKQPNR